MNPTNWPVLPWNTLSLSGRFLLLSITICFVCILGFLILSQSKKIRYLLFKKIYTYVILFSANILFMFTFFWYVAIVLAFIVTINTYFSVKKEMVEIQETELKGGWCCNFKWREKQIEDLNLKTPDEQQIILEYYKNHPVYLNPVLIFIISDLIPILITIILWKCGVGYRWENYSLI